MKKYRVTRISKGRGQFREICIPGHEMRQDLKRYFLEVREIMIAKCDYRVVHGFMPGRSCVSNASYHAGFRYTLTMDLRHFFDTVTRKHVIDAIRGHVLDKIMIDGIAKQGLSTSPMLANIAAIPMDTALGKLGLRYTRYADDLTFSSNTKQIILDAKELAPAIISDHGFEVNPKKTHTQGWRAGRRIITGLAVDDMVHQTRKNRRKARAATHQEHLGGACGLEQWWREPTLRCPICWKKQRQDTMHGLIAHVVYCHGSIFSGTSHDEIQPYIAKAMKLVTHNGGIVDFVDVYHTIREDLIMCHLMEQMNRA